MYFLQFCKTEKLWMLTFEYFWTKKCILPQCETLQWPIFGPIARHSITRCRNASIRQSSLCWPLALHVEQLLHQKEEKLVKTIRYKNPCFHFTEKKCILQIPWRGWRSNERSKSQNDSICQNWLCRSEQRPLFWTFDLSFGCYQSCSFLCIDWSWQPRGNSKFLTVVFKSSRYSTNSFHVQ